VNPNPLVDHDYDGQQQVNEAVVAAGPARASLRPSDRLGG
jgi:hypothetical protein